MKPVLLMTLIADLHCKSAIKDCAVKMYPGDISRNVFGKGILEKLNNCLQSLINPVLWIYDSH